MQNQAVKQRARSSTIVSALLAVVLAMGTMMVPMSMAFAAPSAGHGTITVKVNDSGFLSNSGYKYKVIKLFTADTIESGLAGTTYTDSTGKHIAWADPTVQSTIVNFLDGTNNPVTLKYTAWLKTKYGVGAEGTLPTLKDSSNNDVTAQNLPQNAIEYISIMINGDSVYGGNSYSGSVADTNQPSTPNRAQRTTFAANLAQALDGLTATTTITAGTASSELPTGYYLVISDDSTNLAAENTPQAGSSAMFVALGNEDVTVTEKTTNVPTIQKQVADDSASATWGKFADANQGQDLDFKVTVTLPTNIQSFNAYDITIADTLPAGMSLKTTGTGGAFDPSADVQLSVSNGNQTGAITLASSGIAQASYVGDVLTVAIDDLYNQTYGNSLAATTLLAPDATVTLTYKAHLDADSHQGQTKNENSVKLTYTADPVTEATDVTAAQTTNVTAYELQVYKVDEDTRQALQNAKFTVQKVTSGNNGADTDADGLRGYITATGSVDTAVAAADAHQFTTDANGKITVPRLDSGIYVLHETSVPNDNYASLATDVTFVIGRTIDSTSYDNISGITTKVSGGEGHWVSDRVMSEQEFNQGYDGVKSIDLTNGVIELVIGNERVIHLPGTGMTPSQLGMVVGLLLVGAGAVMVVVRRRRNQGQGDGTGQAQD